MSKDVRDNPYKTVRKRVAPPTKVIHGSKYDKTKTRRREKNIIEQGITEYYNEKDDV